ncbi:MAG: hypothetical protein ACLTEE_00120 [Anaerobutyricum hallii]
MGVNFAGALLISWLYGKGKALRHILPFLLIISLVQGGGQLIVSFTNSAIAAFIPTTLALVVGWLILSAGFYTKPWKMDSKLMVRRENEEIEKQLNKTITTEQLVEVKENSFNKPITNGQAIFPFIILAAISVIVLLIKPIHEVMNQTIFALSFPQIETGERIHRRGNRQLWRNPYIHPCGIRPFTYRNCYTLFILAKGISG